MKRFLIIAIVAVIGLLAGAAIAGLPSSVPDDLVITDIPASESRPTMQTLPPSATTGPRARSDRSGIRRSAPPDGGLSTTMPLPTTTSSTTTTTTTTMATTTTTTAAATTTVSPPAGVRIVVVNAAGTAGLAGSYAQTLTDLGYVSPSATDSNASSDTSGVFFGPGFDAEARRLARQVDIPPQSVAPGPPPDLDPNDAVSDLWLVLGVDRDG